MPLGEAPFIEAYYPEKPMKTGRAHLFSNAVEVTNIRAVKGILSNYYLGVQWRFDDRGRLLFGSRNAELYAAPLAKLPPKPAGIDTAGKLWPPPRLIYQRGEDDFLAMLSALTPYLTRPLWITYIFRAVGLCTSGIGFFAKPGQAKAEQIEFGYSDSAEQS
jgi:hypothetical protein